MAATHDPKEVQTYALSNELVSLIQSLCDLALKTGGTKNLMPVTQVLTALVPQTKPEPPKEPEPEK